MIGEQLGEIMLFHFYAMLSRMKYINRWVLMRNSRYENLSEHSYDVAVIAHSLALIRNHRFGGDVDVGRVLAAALYHDIGETMTGDMPTPVKYGNKELTDAYKQIEAGSHQRLLQMLPQDLRDIYAGHMEADDETVRNIVKAADKISALIKCLEEAKTGNRDFASAEAAQRDYLKDCALPEVKVFMQEFLPSYELELDRLQE